MKTTKEIINELVNNDEIITGEFGEIELKKPNIKWFSEEEIRKTVEEMFKYNEKTGTKLGYASKNWVLKKLFRSGKK